MKRPIVALATAAVVTAGAIAPAQAVETSSPTNFVTGSFTGSSDPAYNGAGSSGSSTLDVALIVLAIAGIDSYLKGNFGPIPPQLQQLLDQARAIFPA